MTLTKILLATDGSANSLHAAEWMADHFDHNNTIIHIVTVVEPLSQATRATYMGWSTTLAANHMSVDAQEVLRITQLRLPNFRATNSVCHGEPVSQILEQSHSISPDLIVVGHRGLHGVDRFFMGSVAKSLVHRARTPILVIPQQ